MDNNLIPSKQNKTKQITHQLNEPLGILAKLIALALFLSVFIALFHFPTLPVLLGCGLTIYAVILFYRPFIWLIAVPALLPVIYLAPYTGWIYFDEFDLFLLVTLAVLFWHGQYSLAPLKSVPALSWMALTPFLLIYFFGILNGMFPLEPIDANSFASYYSQYNSLRVGKGLIWALLLWPALLNHLNKAEKNKRLIFFGITLGAFGTILAIFRERGVIHDVFYGESWRELLHSLLDFSTQYRITAMFADIHTGGTSIDGYLALTIPLVFFLITHSRGKTRFWSSLVAAGLLYGAAVTFSRGVYLGLGVQLLISLAIFFNHHRASLNLRDLVILLISALISLAALIISYQKGGFYALLALLTLYSGFVISSAIPSANKSSRVLIVGGLFIAGNALAIYAMHTSQWVENTLLTSALYSLFLSVILLAISPHSTRVLLKTCNIRQLLGLIALFWVFIIMLLPPLLGTTVANRFTTVSKDFQHRIDHWKTAIEITNKKPQSAIAGVGVGRFPSSYYWEVQNAKEVGSYKLIERDSNSFLSFSGAHDLKVGQIINIQPKTNYQLRFDYKTNDAVVPIFIKICHRQIIQPYEWNPTCKVFSKKAPRTNGKWKRLAWNFNSDKLGTFENMTVAPVVLTISNRRKYEFNNKPQTFLAIDNFILRSVDGPPILKNGRFDEGLNHWFGYYDFDHLPWHIKNIWVNYYFELGLIGLISLLILVGTAIIRLAKRVLNGSDSAPFLLASLLGFLAVGSFGTIVDAPRVAMLFYLILLSSLSESTPIRNESTAL